MRLKGRRIAPERCRHDLPPKYCADALVTEDGSGPSGHEPLDSALNELEREDQRVNDFIERLNCAVEDIGRKKLIDENVQY
jgi:hypothetical protein